jgi:hypothetical protein
VRFAGAARKPKAKSKVAGKDARPTRLLRDG